MLLCHVSHLFPLYAFFNFWLSYSSSYYYSSSNPSFPFYDSFSFLLLLTLPLLFLQPLFSFFDSSSPHLIFYKFGYYSLFTCLSLSLSYSTHNKKKTILSLSLFNFLLSIGGFCLLFLASLQWISDRFCSVFWCFVFQCFCSVFWSFDHLILVQVNIQLF